MILPESGPPGLSIATMHSAPAIYETVRGGFQVYMASRVSLKGLYGRVRLQGQGLSWEDQI